MLQVPDEFNVLHQRIQADDIRGRSNHTKVQLGPQQLGDLVNANILFATDITWVIRSQKSLYMSALKACIDELYAENDTPEDDTAFFVFQQWADDLQVGTRVVALLGQLNRMRLR